MTIDITLLLVLLVLFVAILAGMWGVVLISWVAEGAYEFIRAHTCKRRH